MGLFKLLKTLKTVLTEASELSGPVNVSFRRAKPWKSQKTGKWYVFFDNVEIEDGQLDKSFPQNVYLQGQGQEFELYSTDLKYDKAKRQISIPMDIFAETNPKGDKFLFTAQPTLDVDPQVPKNIQSPDDVMKSHIIRMALSKAFPDNWKERDETFSPGLRGIHTIGEKMGNDESWSVMNYFDTKKEIKKMLYDKFMSEGGGDVTKWLVDTFKKDDEFVQKLVNRQWSSIKNGLETEDKVLKKLIEKSGSNNFMTFPAGSIMDRYNGIDVVIDGKSFQVKPLKDGKRNMDGDKKSYTIYTYGMKDYKGKPVDYIAYVKDNGDYAIFNNSDYNVVSPSEVTHFGPPQKPF